MQYRLTNQTRSLLVIPMRSGIALHVAPGQKSEPVEEYEIEGNSKIAKLQKLGMVSVVPAGR